jgi:ligand-binding sensor protein
LKSDFEGSKYHNIVQEDKNRKEYSRPCNFPFFSQIFQSINRIISTCREFFMSDKNEVVFQDIEKLICEKAINDWKSIIAENVSMVMDTIALK